MSRSFHANLTSASEAAEHEKKSTEDKVLQDIIIRNPTLFQPGFNEDPQNVKVRIEGGTKTLKQRIPGKSGNNGTTYLNLINRHRQTLKLDPIPSFKGKTSAVAENIKEKNEMAIGDLNLRGPMRYDPKMREEDEKILKEIEDKIDEGKEITPDELDNFRSHVLEENFDNDEEINEWIRDNVKLSGKSMTKDEQIQYEKELEERNKLKESLLNMDPYLNPPPGPNIDTNIPTGYLSPPSGPNIDTNIPIGTVKHPDLMSMQRIIAEDLEMINRDFYNLQDWEQNGNLMHNNRYNYNITKEKYDEQIKKHEGAVDSVESTAGPSLVGSILSGATIAATGNPALGLVAGEAGNLATRAIVSEVNEETSQSIGSLQLSDIESLPSGPNIDTNIPIGPGKPHISTLNEQTNYSNLLESSDIESSRMANSSESGSSNSTRSNNFEDNTTEETLRQIFGNLDENSLYQEDDNSVNIRPGGVDPEGQIIREAVNEQNALGKNDKKPVKKVLTYQGAIHKDALELYFGSSITPSWNWTLFAGRKLNFKKGSVKKYLWMQSMKIIEKYGIELLVYKLVYGLKSSEENIYKENHEILQLYFSYINNKNQFSQLAIPGINSQVQSDQIVRVRLGDLIGEHNLLADAQNGAQDYNNYGNVGKNNVGEITPQLVEKVAEKIEEYKQAQKINFGISQKVPGMVVLKMTDEYDCSCCDDKPKNKIIIRKKMNKKY